MTFFSRLQNIGVRTSYPNYVNNKIVLSNLLAFFIIILVALPFTIIAATYAAFLVFIPVLGIVAMSCVWLLNKSGGVYLARILSAVTPLTLAVWFTAYLTSPHTSPPLVMVLICMAFAILPFLVFDIREKPYLIFSAILNFALFLSLGKLSEIFIKEVDVSFISSGFLYQMNYVIAILLAFTIVFMLAFIGYRAELKSQKLIDDNKKQTSELQKSEEVLKQNLDEVQRVQEEEKNRAWVTEGLGRVNNLTRAQNDPDKLSKEVISEVAKYLGANQGAIYLVEKGDTESEEPYMEMKAAFAFGRKKNMSDKVRAGEGLIGQCFLEKDMIFLTEVPENFVKIKSGLGDATPRNIVIVPLLANEEVEGIIEVASFEVLANHKIDYLKKLGESLATSFNLNKVNANTRRLLELSQEQEEQMRSQAEELHQNMEELQATQEEMERKSRETEEQNQQLQQQEEELKQNMEEMSAQAEEMERNMNRMETLQQEMQARENILDETTIISEADLFGNIIYTNNKLSEVSKYSKEEMMGKPHSLFRHPDMPKEIFKSVWNTIQSGKMFRGIIKNRAKDGSVYWVDAVISPVMNENNKPIKYVGVRYVIEEEKIAQQLFDKQLKRMKLK
ncbi:PAS domain-containing protein [Marivirga sp. S37H4]|uniref:PAS domain-containing protein n=1 Tax=Marivirga aurantiaca TaxID=2802615 RepID=A0A934WW76_9BACT|nr:PAS domain-containing protein [Marivirga aurantiaca]MBK6263975.1 PAS domain-containing protein [Marivirga aurantiaca]